jgi:two-component system, NtrC family, nitrogen regulation sensor histidine kinase NtrY
MGFRDFRANVLARLCLLGALIVLFAWSVVGTEWQVTPLVCAALAFLAAIELVRYVESVNRELTGFLEFVAHHDFSASFPIAEKGRVFRELESAYKVLARTFRDLNRERAANHQYLEALVEHVSTALVCLDNGGTVQLMNRQAKALFKSPHLHGTRSFAKIDPKLPDAIDELRDGGRALLTVEIAGEPLQLALFATEFELLDRRYKLISFQNIRDELEQREIDFSQKLLKVLTHEIMNSVTPMISLSKVIEESLLDVRCGKESAKELAPDEEEDLLRSAASIQSRGAGLLRFVQAYGALTNLPRPRLTTVGLAALLEQVARLMRATLPAGITIETRVEDPDLSVRADSEQLQQVLINLIKNAVEALAGREDGRILLAAATDAQGKTLVQVVDDGPGIDPEQLDNVFVPFFTTKRDGTGVGLSVSRQIMFLNKGLIFVKSVPGRGCEFTLRFR